VPAPAQDGVGVASEFAGQVMLPRINGNLHRPDVVIWLNPLDEKLVVQEAAPGRYTLLQKNRMFSPHLLVIPVGSVVNFPNADPFFHNVFSLFNGKRFDLGLYETGSSKEVLFSREGISYIFCNIHPEMSAVVLVLSTPMYAIADPSAKFAIHQVPPGDYDLHVWIEGTPQPALDRLSRRIHIRAGAPSNAIIDASSSPMSTGQHLNKYGKPYDSNSTSKY
jgi:hypothetical protein